jgi:hypothetical protein
VNRARFLSVFFLAIFSGIAAGTELPCEFHDGLIWLKVSATAQELNFVLDSGAGRTVLDLGTARRLGASLGKPCVVQGVEGSVRSYEVQGFAARAGGIALCPKPLSMDLAAISRACGRKIDGVIGLDFFRQHAVRIDYGRRTVSLLEGAAHAGEALPLLPRGDAVGVKVSVDGHAAQWMRVDTGCDAALHWVTTESPKAKPARASVALSAKLPATTTTTVQLGSRLIPAVKTSLHSTPLFRGEAGLIGNGLLSQFVVTVDLPRRQLTLGR